MPIKLKNSYQNLPNSFFEKASAATWPSPQLLLFNETLAAELTFPFRDYSKDDLALLFSGQKLLQGSSPIAMAYAGFQFGQPVPSLGDGRALLLGDLNGFDIQLKGSGVTPFSRRGDGKSALGPVLREYIVSEAMNNLGVPTTRALAAVATGENVLRQFGPEPGGIFTRIAPSHIRVGTFQYFSFRNEIESIKTLLDFTINRHYPELIGLETYREKALMMLKSFSQKQGDLIAHWSSLGFIHGVMNTDNCALGGFTIDYGPCAFMDEFEFNKVFSSIDKFGRYSYFNQVSIIQWNILRLADTLLPLISEKQETAISLINSELIPLLETFPSLRAKKLSEKLGITDFKASDAALVMEFLEYIQEKSLDFTLSFRNLPQLYRGESAFYPPSQKLNHFLEKWKNRVSCIEHLNLINPLYIPRNHLVQKAIDLTYEGDLSFTRKLLEVLADPYTKKDESDEFASAPKESERVLNTFCGT